MSVSIILTAKQFEEMESKTGLVSKWSEEQRKLKHKLITSIADAYGDKWERMKKETREVVETIAYLATTRGYTYAGDKYLADLRGVSVRTVENIRKFLRESGLVQIVYRRAAKGNNAKGAPVYIFTEHPYFNEWVSLLDLDCGDSYGDDCGDEKPETSTEPTVSGEENVSTLDLPKTYLKEFSNINNMDGEPSVSLEQEYEFNRDKYIKAAGVPIDVSHTLAGYKTDETIKIWRAIDKWLMNYDISYEDSSEEILEGLARAKTALRIFMEKGGNIADFNMIGCSIGKIKQVFSEIIEEAIDVEKRAGLRGILHYDPFNQPTEDEIEQAGNVVVRFYHMAVGLGLIKDSELEQAI